MRKLFWILLLIPALALADGSGQLRVGQQGGVTFEANSALDSARAWFCFDGDGGVDTANCYVSIKLTPCFSGDGKLLCGDGLELDSVGGHTVKVLGYASGAVAVVSGGTWWNDANVVDFQGSAAGLSAAEILDSLLLRGYVMNAAGAFACTISVRDSSLTAGIPGVTVNVRNSAQTATLRYGTTNGDGLVIFGLDSLGTGSSYKLWLQELSYNFTMPETLDLRTDTNFTVYGTAFDWGSPPPDSQVSIVGQVFNPFLDSLSGIIVSARFYIPEDSLHKYPMVTYLGHPISPFTVSDTTTVTGRFRLDLIPNDRVRPDTTRYIWNFQYPVLGGGYFTPQDQDTTYIEWQAAEKKWSELIGR